MEQEGIVIKTENSFLEALVIRESGCGGNCKSCAGCSSESKPITVKLLNELDAKVGDRILLQIENGIVIRYSLIMYFIPLIFFVFGLVSGIMILSENNVSNYELKSFGIGIISLLTSFLILKILDKKIFNKRNDVIKAIRILNFEEE